ncbi:MAG TPA: tetratricopeptide repeat protein, partial [Pirellulaceae bacterium]
MRHVHLGWIVLVAGLLAWGNTVSAQATKEHKSKSKWTEKESNDVQKALRQLQHGEVDEAIETLEKALDEDPDNEQALFAAGQAYSHRGVEMAREDRKAANVPLRRGAKLMRHLAEIKEDLSTQEKEVLTISIYNEACCFAIDGKTKKAL